jgi:hypothetical protein
MAQCKCGFTRDPDNKCNGTHKVVQSVRDDIVAKIEALPVEYAYTNALGMKMMAIKVAKGE